MLPVELTAPALFVAGATTSLHCALMCGAINAAQARSHGPLPLRDALLLVHGGRVLGYALLGVLAGALGARLSLWLPATETGLALQVLAALALVAAGIQQLRGRRHRAHAAGCQPQLRRLGGMPPRARLFAQGLAWALMPCGILYTIVLLAALTASPLSGFALLAAFGLGTVPLMGISGGLFGLATRPQDTRALRYGAGAALILIGVGAAAAAGLQGDLVTAWLCAPG